MTANKVKSASGIIPIQFVTIFSPTSLIITPLSIEGFMYNCTTISYKVVFLNNVQKLLLLTIFFVLMAFALFHIYIPIIFTILFMGFLKIVLHNPKFENAREKFETLF